MRESRDFIFAAVANERRQIATLIDQLDDAQLAMESLCAGWDIKTVAAHLVSVFADGFWVFQWMALRHGGVQRAIDELARRRAAIPASEIVATLRQGADHELNPPITGPLSGLTDVLVHGGDIRIPLGLPFDPDPQLVSPHSIFLPALDRWVLCRAIDCEGSACRAPTSTDPGVRAPKSADPLAH